MFKLANPFIVRIMIIGIMVLVFGIPLAYIESIISNRTNERQSASSSIAASYAHQQTITGPILWIPYNLSEVIETEKDGKKVKSTQQVDHFQLLFPDQVNVHAKLETSTRYRGIFPVSVYDSHHAMNIHWKIPRQKLTLPTGATIGMPMIIFKLSDLRGLRSAPQLIWKNATITGQSIQANNAIHANIGLPITWTELQSFADTPQIMQIQFDLAGSSGVHWVPLANQSQIELNSNWQHPSFIGNFLPSERSISSNGFTAKWSLPSIASENQGLIESGYEVEIHDIPNNTPDFSTKNKSLQYFGVHLKDPIDVYSLSERATKYGMMFVLLVFTLTSVCELIYKWCVHPVQYIMIGSTLVIFFLLLLSLAEHFGFLNAYLLGSGACILLSSYYMYHVLNQQWRSSLGFASMLVLLYGAIYMILSSEDHALLMGTLLLFSILTFVMISTRKVQWHGLKMGEPSTSSTSNPTQ